MKQKTKDSIGALFLNTKRKNPRAPSMMGTTHLNTQLFHESMNIYEETGEVQLQLSAWKNIASETGMHYLTLKAQIPWEQRCNNSNDDDFQFLADMN